MPDYPLQPDGPTHASARSVWACVHSSSFRVDPCVPVLFGVDLKSLRRLLLGSWAVSLPGGGVIASGTIAVPRYLLLHVVSLISCTNVCVHFFFTCEHLTMLAKWSRGVWSTGEKRKIDHCSAVLGWLKRCIECWENNAKQSKARTAVAGRTLSHRHACQGIRERGTILPQRGSSPRWPRHQLPRWSH